MIRQEIVSVLQNAFHSAGFDKYTARIETSSKADFGDYTCTQALELAKHLLENPMEIAQKIVDFIPPHSGIEKISIVRPGFINFFISHAFLIEELKKIVSGEFFSALRSPQSRNVIVEFSSPNIAKPFTIGHLRSTIIGDAISRILEKNGYSVFRDNHVGDWGTQFGKLMYAIRAWGNEEQIANSSRPVKMLVELYVRFHEEADNNPQLEEEGRTWFKKLEDGDQEARTLWQKCVHWSWKEFAHIYEMLGVTFTENEGRGFGESYFETMLPQVISEVRDNLEKKNHYLQSNGAQLITFDNDSLPPLMIVKKDGATLYATRDLATDRFRLQRKEYGSNVWIINEVGIEQSLYFQQLYAAEELLGWTTKGQRTHVRHGLYRFADIKMSTRKGNTIWLEDVLHEAIQKARTLMESKNTTNSKENEASTFAVHAVAIGALKWNDLKRSPHLDVIFDWNELLNMNGNSGPYIQYTYVRCVSILKKTKETEEHTKYSNDFASDQDLQLARLMMKWPDTIAAAASQLNPSIICTYLFELTQEFNAFYQTHPILKAENDSKSMRLLIVQAIAAIIKEGLSSLGIETIDKM